MEEMVRLGMSPLEVIRSATLGNAGALGMGRHIGSIEEGKFADLLILKSEPTKDLTPLKNIRGVMKNGTLLKESEG